jgi:DNA-binding Lrp family transcriptional regulator
MVFYHTQPAKVKENTMIFGRTNVAFLNSDTFRKWPLEAKAVYAIIPALANYQTGEFLHATKTIAHKVNLSPRAVRRSLRRIEAAGEITITDLAYRKRKYTYNFIARLRTGESAMRTGESALRTGESASSDKKSPQSPTTSASTTTPAPPNKNFLTRGFLTTTGSGIHTGNTNGTTENESVVVVSSNSSAAHRISPSLIAEMAEVHGAAIVQKVVAAMQSMDGEVENANAYFRRCCERGWIPTSKKAKEREKAAAAIAELEIELQRVKLTPAEKFERPPHTGIPSTPQELKAETIELLEARLQALRRI